MCKKPDRKTAMQNIITLVRADFPFDAPDAQICAETCVGCPKKLLELTEIEIIHWESEMANGESPTFDEIYHFAKLCKNIRRGLVRSGIIT